MRVADTAVGGLVPPSEIILWDAGALPGDYLPVSTGIPLVLYDDDPEDVTWDGVKLDEDGFDEDEISPEP